jgi:hypothetical protein
VPSFDPAARQTFGTQKIDRGALAVAAGERQFRSGNQPGFGCRPGSDCRDRH